MDKIQYYVNKDARTVVCVINSTEKSFLNYLAHRPMNEFFYSTFFSHDKRMKLFMPKTFKGVAKCNPNDEWNEEIGKLIAYDKARMKENASFFKRAQFVLDELNKFGDMFYEQINAYGARLERAHDARTATITKSVGTEK